MLEVWRRPGEGVFRTPGVMPVGFLRCGLPLNIAIGVSAVLPDKVKGCATQAPPGAQERPAHGALYRVGTRSLQDLLGGLKARQGFEIGWLAQIDQRHDRPNRSGSNRSSLSSAPVRQLKLEKVGEKIPTRWLAERDTRPISPKADSWSRKAASSPTSCFEGVDAAGWKQAIEGENVLRKRSPTTASTKAALIRSRLQTMSEGLWQLVRDGSKPVATHAVFAATIKYSPLVGDFLDLVVRDLYRRFEDTLKPQHWDRYLEDCRSRDPEMPQWAATTQEKLRTRVFGMMTEAGYLSDSRTRTLKPDACIAGGCAVSEGVR